MASGINIDFTANTRSLLGGTKDVEKAFEDVSDSLDDMVKDADKAGDKVGDKLSDSIKDGVRDSDRQLEKLEKSFKEVAEASKRESRKASESLSRNIKEGESRASRSMDEIKDEAKQNASETFSSFDGSAQSLIDGLQGTFGGLVASIAGPAGMFAAIAGAAGIGLISSAFQNAQAEEEAFKQHVSDLAQEFIETGKVGKRSVEDLVETLKDMATTTDDGEDSLKDLKKAADDSGHSFRDLARAYAGNEDGLKKLWRESEKQIEALKKEKENVKGTIGARRLAREEIQQQINKQKEYQGYIGKGLGVFRESAKEQKLWAEAGGPELQRKKQLIDQVNDAYDDAAGDVQTYVDKETGLFDTSKYITAMETRMKELRNYQKTLATSGLSDKAKKFLESQGETAAAKMLAGYTKASPETKAKLNNIWTEAGSEASGKAATAIKDGLPDSVKGPDVKVKADTSSYDRQIRKIKRSSPTVWVNVRARPGRGLP